VINIPSVRNKSNIFSINKCKEEKRKTIYKNIKIKKNSDKINI